MLCENNQYVELTPQSLHVAGEIWRRGEGYDVPGVRVNGNDVDEVSEAMADAVARARGGSGPTIIEALTYRWFGHYAGDKAAYRTDEEVDEWRGRDPLKVARERLGDAEADAADAEVEEEIGRALEYALESPITGPDALAIDHYAHA